MKTVSDAANWILDFLHGVPESKLLLALVENKLLLGLVVSVFVGGLVMLLLEFLLRIFTGPKWYYEERLGVPGWLTGFIERGVFTFLVAYGLEDVGTLMAGWLALKLASNWNRPEMKGEGASAFALAALLLGLVSMALAMLGGQVALNKKPLWW